MSVIAHWYRHDHTQLIWTVVMSCLVTGHCSQCIIITRPQAGNNDNNNLTSKVCFGSRLATVSICLVVKTCAEGSMI